MNTNWNKVLFGQFVIFLASLALTEHVHSQILVDNSTTGFYNDSLGGALNGTSPLFPINNDPVIDPAPEPDLTPASLVLGNWLSEPDELNENWSASEIPSSWTVLTETAIVYRLEIQRPLAGLRILIGVDNGAFIWLDGQYLGGHLRPGGAPLGELTLETAPVACGTHFLQILREDHGGITGFTIRVEAIQENSSNLEISSQLPVLSRSISGNLTEQISEVKSIPPVTGFSPGSRHEDFHEQSSFNCESNGAFEPPAVGDLDDSRISDLRNGNVAELTNDTLTNPNSIFIFAEQNGIQTDQPINVDWRAGVDGFNVTYGGTTQPTGGSIPAGTLVTSHLLHFDTLDNESATNAGAASFESEILGVILCTEFLNATDSFLGVAGVNYPNASGRAWEIGGESASINISSCLLYTSPSPRD